MVLKSTTRVKKMFCKNFDTTVRDNTIFCQSVISLELLTPTPCPLIAHSFAHRILQKHVVDYDAND